MCLRWDGISPGSKSIEDLKHEEEVLRILGDIDVLSETGTYERTASATDGVQHPMTGLSSYSLPSKRTRPLPRRVELQEVATRSEIMEVTKGRRSSHLEWNRATLPGPKGTQTGLHPG